MQEALYTYFASGKPKRLQLGTAQGIDYRYNERDWLTMINHPDFPTSYDPDGDGTNRIQYDRFGMMIEYNKTAPFRTQQTATMQYNGNISWTKYKISGSTPALVGYTYKYDNYNRLTEADFIQNLNSTWQTTTAYDEKVTSYDNNGNILALTRNGSSGSVVDGLSYNYGTTNNRLNSVSGNTPSTYTYDANGNMLTDSYKNIAFINYNADNLPVTVYFNNGDKLVNNYDMSGNRVRKQYITSGTNNSDTYYFNSKEGISEVVDLVPYGYNYTYNIWGNDNIGQVRVNGGDFNRFYYLKDHLGSIRVIVKSNGDVDSYDDYYPFGKVMDGRSSILNADTRYKFTSKERDVQTNYDYFGARFYDSRVARWLSVDPKSSARPDLSTYNYCQNNPLRMVDPTGALDTDFMKDDGTTIPFVNAANILTTAFFDFKHSVENLILAWKPADEGMKWEAGYAKDENGQEIFKTEIKQVPSNGWLGDRVSNAFDVINIVGGATTKVDGAALLAKGTSRNQALEPVRRTTKEYTAVAKELGYTKTKNFNFDSHGQAVYKKGNTFITPDVDGHKGGFWKMMNHKFERIGTYNKGLDKMIGD